MPFDEVGRALICRQAEIWRALRYTVPGRDESLEGAPSHMIGAETLSDLRSLPASRASCGPQNRVAGSCGPWISPP